MKELADGVYHLQCLPGLPWAVNAYLIDDVLIDAGTRQSTKRLLKQIGDRQLGSHAVTHAHPDHQGASHEICVAREIPMFAPELDVPAIEDSSLIKERQPDKVMARFFNRIFVGPSHPVDKALKEGDTVAGFKVLDTPGHSLGHITFWRESDGVAIIGDVLANMDQYTGIPGLNAPKDALTPDPERNRESARRVADLNPELVLFGHGAPLRDPAKLSAFVSKLG